MDDNNRYLAWFLGPKAEHADLMESILMLVLRDYIHWRRNYFPGDKILVNKTMQRELEDSYDALSQNVMELTAELRRNFPFYSPRYIGHQLSDTSMPAMIGYIAGMLYNPNNVTPEAAPVTVGWEIEACNQILAMLGYAVPPNPPASARDLQDYERKLQQEFGWAHITLGGTTANIEALWIARTVRYFPLAVRQVAIDNDLDIAVHSAVARPGESVKAKDIKEYAEREVLGLRPNEAIYLLGKYVDAVRRKFGVTIEKAGERAWQLLNESEYGLAKGTGALFYRHPPVIFVSGAAHYSISKAADILGVGRDNVVSVKLAQDFRVDVADLEHKIRAAIREGKIPLAVIAVVGTTEEGAVDPVHEIVDLRSRLETELNFSFWLHIDAAWGGFIRTLFRDADAVLFQISRRMQIEFPIHLPSWHESLIEKFLLLIAERQDSDALREKLRNVDMRLQLHIAAGNVEAYIKSLRVFLAPPWNDIAPLVRGDFEPDLQSKVEMVDAFTLDSMQIVWGEYQKKKQIKWGSRDLCSAFVAFSSADSITVDPHKMGYVPYPCGVVALKNDRVRHFILQQAPYITSATQNALMHVPPKHLDSGAVEAGGWRVDIDAFAPFVLEGSKPGAAASALWTAVRTIPLTSREHGTIVRASLLAARELYEWIINWDKIVQAGKDTDYEIVPLIDRPPDTNIVIFAVKKRTSSALHAMNLLTKAVYDQFTIQAELGDQKYSYSQPFFLSKTTCSEPKYSYDTLRNFFIRSKLRNHAPTYKSEGLVVLRATVMNPYIHPLRKMGIQDVMRDFIVELDKAASMGVNEIR